MQGSLIQMQITLVSFNDIPPHEPPIQASSNQYPGYEYGLLMT